MGNEAYEAENWDTAASEFGRYIANQQRILINVFILIYKLSFSTLVKSSTSAKSASKPV